MFFQGEALLWRQSEYLVGTGRRKGKRGSPVDMNPRGPLRGGPERSAKEPQTPFPKTSQHNANWGKGGERTKKTKRPTLVTVEEGGRTRTWGPLSRTTSWRVGCFWEEMQGAAKVFLKKDEKVEEVQVVKRIEGGRERFWFEE